MGMNKIGLDNEQTSETFIGKLQELHHVNNQIIIHWQINEFQTEIELI